MEPALIEQQDMDRFTGYPVKIEIFEGPVDLLAYLIKREELDVSEVSLAAITGQYLEYLHTMEAVNIEVVGKFIVTAATLLWIKARRLLPATPAEQPEEDDELELADQIQWRLAQYRAYKQAAQVLDKSRQLRRRIYVRALEEDSELDSGFVRLDDVSIFDILGAVRDLLDRATAQPPGTVERPAVSLTECIEEILFRLRVAGADQPLTFAELVGTPVTRQLVIMSFLAVLELIRRGLIDVRQDRPYEGIVIRLISDSERISEPAAGSTQQISI